MLNRMNTSQAADTSPHDQAPRASEFHAPLVAVCDELVGLLERINSADGPYNRAEAGQLPEEDLQAAYRRQVEMIDRLECLSRQISSRVGASEAEVDAKVRALDALTSVASWDRESLRVLRVSIERDREHLKQGSHEVSPPPPPQKGWLLQRFSRYARARR